MQGKKFNIYSNILIIRKKALMYSKRNTEANSLNKAQLYTINNKLGTKL